MIALIAFACGRSDRHFRTPAPNTPGNNNKPGYQDDGSSGGMLISTEGSLATGKPIKVQTNLTIPGATALSVNVDKGYYNIRTSYDTGLVQWVLKDGDKDLAKLNTDDNPAASFDIYFATAKNYQFELVFTGTETCSLTIDFEPSYGPYWPDKFIMDLNKNYASITYPHVFRNQSPEPGGYFLGDWGYGGTFPEVKTSLIFTRSEYGEYRKDHVLSVYEVNVQGLDYTESSNLTQRAAPEDHIWDFQVGIDPAQQFDTGGFINIIVRLKDEDEHIYDCRWEFRWHPRLPIATACNGYHDENNSLTKIDFILNRPFEPQEREFVNVDNAITVTINGQTLNLPNPNITALNASTLTVVLPQPVPETQISALVKLPLMITITAPEELRKKYHMPKFPFSIVSPTFWSDDSYIEDTRSSSGLDFDQYQTGFSSLDDCGCGSNQVRYLSETIDDLCTGCKDIDPTEPHPTASSIYPPSKPKEPDPNEPCCEKKYLKVFDKTSTIESPCLHVANSCKDKHWLHLEACPENYCIIEPLVTVETSYLSTVYSSIFPDENYRAHNNNYDHDCFGKKMLAESKTEETKGGSANYSKNFKRSWSHFSNVYLELKFRKPQIVNGRVEFVECEPSFKKMFAGDRKEPTMTVELIEPANYSNNGITLDHQIPEGAFETKYTDCNKTLIDSYVRMGCGAFIKVVYNDDQCVWDYAKHAGNIQKDENGRLMFFIRPTGKNFDKINATPEQHEMMWQLANMQGSWIWTNSTTETPKSSSEPYVDWYIVAPTYFEPQDNKDNWSAVPYAWLRDTPEYNTYAKDFDPPIQEKPNYERYWEKFELKIVCQDDWSAVEARHCNFTSQKVVVDNFAWTQGYKMAKWYMHNPHLDPDRPQTIKLEPQDVKAPNDPFGTMAEIDTGWAHYINSKAANDTDTPDKNNYCNFKVYHNLPPAPRNLPPESDLYKFNFYYYDPAINCKPDGVVDNPHLETSIFIGNDNGYRKDNDNKGYSKGFYYYNLLSPYQYSPTLKVERRKLNNGDSIYFDTSYYGGDNFIPKVIYTTPTCFAWGRLGQDIQTVTTWRKYPVYISNLSPEGTSYTVSNHFANVRDYVKYAYNDAFIEIFQQLNQDKRVPYDEEQERYKGGKTSNVEDAWEWLVHMSDGICDYHDISSRNNIVHNPHLMFYYNPIIDNFGDHLGYSINTGNDHPILMIDQNHISLQYRQLDGDEVYHRFLAYYCIHELGHVIGHLDHGVYPRYPDWVNLDGHLSVMQYFPDDRHEIETKDPNWENSGFPNGYPWVMVGDKRTPILYFSEFHIDNLRSGSKYQEDYKLPGYFNYRGEK